MHRPLGEALKQIYVPPKRPIIEDAHNPRERVSKIARGLCELGFRPTAVRVLATHGLIEEAAQVTDSTPPGFSSKYSRALLLSIARPNEASELMMRTLEDPPFETFLAATIIAQTNPDAAYARARRFVKDRNRKWENLEVGRKWGRTWDEELAYYKFKLGYLAEDSKIIDAAGAIIRKQYDEKRANGEYLVRFVLGISKEEPEELSVMFSRIENITYLVELAKGDVRGAIDALNQIDDLELRLRNYQKILRDPELFWTFTIDQWEQVIEHYKIARDAAVTWANSNNTAELKELGAPVERQGTVTETERRIIRYLVSLEQRQDASYWGQRGIEPDREMMFNLGALRAEKCRTVNNREDAIATAARLYLSVGATNFAVSFLARCARDGEGAVVVKIVRELYGVYMDMRALEKLLRNALADGNRKLAAALTQIDEKIMVDQFEITITQALKHNDIEALEIIGRIIIANPELVKLLTPTNTEDLIRILSASDDPQTRQELEKIRRITGRKINAPNAKTQDRHDRSEDPKKRWN
ncbi:hypothetical protein HY990_07160 [Candidatus Micrarchaeota archaeon]|nr:hypothetical protein [Candidatus Micrarchaeota archaeon]